MGLTLNRLSSRWLISREVHPSVGREAWMRDEPAVIRTGIHFEAVRLPADLVHGLAATVADEAVSRQSVERAFHGVGIHGAVIADPARRRYYALVPPGTAEEWADLGFECLGRDHYLGVPAAHRAEPPGTHWLLSPPEGEDDLCDVDAVRRLMDARCEGRRG
ncbi:hypothetical protein [Streptomyces syringium]|uniref:hypothetical protein n=1 Tax=Streptomyces syringium TaxID=76729 RepID=UPI003AAA9D48